MKKDILLTKLIRHYNKVIVKANKLSDINDIKCLLTDTYTYAGVCACARFKFGTSIYDKKWVTKHSHTFDKDGNAYWCNEPISTKSKTQVIARLKLRVNIMTKMLPKII